MTLDLSWVDSYGYVKFVATGVQDDETIYRVNPGSDTLIKIVGFEFDDWFDASGNGFGEDYRPPLGASLQYVIAPDDATSAAEATQSAWINTPGNVAWLRDVTEPALSQRVIVISTGDEQEPARHSVYDISGRHLPLVVFDVRQGRRGTLQLLVTNYVDSDGVQLRTGSQSRLNLERLLLKGIPLLLTMCSSLLWVPCMMAIGNATFTRVGSRDNWILQLDYIEVDDPRNYLLTRIANPSFGDHLNNEGGLAITGDPPPPVTYEQLHERYPTYLDVATGERADA